MHIQVGKWGNSYAVRIPGMMAKEMGLRDGSELDLQQIDGSLVLRLIETKRPEYSLEAMLSEVTPENLHSETAWGEEIGREISE